MKETRFKLKLSAPVDEQGRVIKLSVINIESLHSLRISHYPEFSWYAMGILFLFSFAAIAAWIDLSTLIWFGIILVILVYNLFNQRAFICSINKKSGKIIYSQSGVLMSSFDEHKGEYDVSKINRIEMQKHLRGGSWPSIGKFQIFLLLDSDQRLALSPNNLEFSECQDFAEQIRCFLGNEIPVKALD